MSSLKVLSKILVDLKKLTQEELDKILLAQKGSGKNLIEFIINEGIISEEELFSLISYYLNIPFIDILKFKVEPEIVKMIPVEIAQKYKLFPLHITSNVLLIAVSEPLDIFILDNIRLAVGCEIKQVLSKQSLIQDFINNYYPKEQDQTLIDILDERTAQQKEDVGASLDALLKEDTSLDLIQESQRQPVVQAVNLVINEAIQMRASDIHLEPAEEELAVRYRIDGILHKMHSIPKKSQRGISARLKILAGLDITKFFIPQDGRFNVRNQGKDIDLRVSSLPMIYGEKFVLRILDKSNVVVKIETLGFSEQSLKLLKEASGENHGMVLITGPTGSGKSTTLYAILAALNTLERHIVTVEDPVEYQVDGIGQTQAKPDIGLTFAAALRGILRQSPDTILIGEIRDAETADIAIKASLTGHLVFSTLHTNDAISAFVRLIDMGVERYLVASSLILICAQRLCRKICKDCKEPLSSFPGDIFKELGMDAVQSQNIYHGRGCSTCNNTGYRGRVAILEALKVDESIRRMVINEVSVEEIKKAAIKENKLITLRRDGLLKVLSGVTTLEEVCRVTSAD